MNNNTDEKDLVLIVDDSSDPLSIHIEAPATVCMATPVSLEGNPHSATA